jgi:RimJ/RimL family protein N-acetyltransferase
MKLLPVEQKNRAAAVSVVHLVIDAGVRSRDDRSPRTLAAMGEEWQFWPLFGLKIRTPRLEMRMPTDPDLFDLAAVARAGVYAPGEMPFLVPWTETPSPEFEYSFLQYHWNLRGSWNPDSWRLELGVWVDGQAAGAQAISADGFAEHRTISTGSWLGRGFQGRGYGKEMRAAVAAFAFDYLEADWVTSAAFEDNAASIGISRSLGYEETTHEIVGDEGNQREAINFLLTRELWYSRERPPIEVDGFDDCRGFFGLWD